MKYPAYPQYKDSGVAWLGEVPEHWDVKRLDFLASVKARLGWKALTASEYVDEGYVFLATPNIKGEQNIDYKNVNYITWERYIESPEIILSEGDVLLAKDGSTLGITNVVRNLPRPATVNSSIAVIRPKNKDAIDSSFLFRWISSSFMQSIIDSLKDGQGVPHLFQSDIRKFTVLTPSLEEQIAIADFLDRETGRIDTLVAKKRKLVELLKEKRSALISRTVTRGLPADVAGEFGLEPNKGFKQSGIEWLGNIPLHWGIQKFSRCAFFQEGPGLRNWQFTQDGVRVICVTNITDSGINFSNYGKFISDEEYQTSYRHFTVSNGDLLLSSSGNSWGKVAEFQSNEIAILNTSTIRINTNVSGTLVRAFVKWLLISDGTREQLGQFMTGSCQPNFGPSHLGRVLVTVPPQVEQTAIAAYLDRETTKIDRLMEKVETAITRLQEYRSTLITAAVTGKIDVRGTA
ncbi:restriction endonuclease subunit S [Methylomonas sp. EFPC3]|uniref:restriction endonuclease subunit S n=1 Tax=Methylomonas sp. EFPC3 TaxID=3021710 RepID=UPI0024162490|nr:restriction endonuclease subunit S [Methylomonas sp. EFPC3]WFP50069.1 restriction endonuclease subunit S [Methylomonas sp. EFPC3]